MPKKQPVYDNESISSLKGAERVRKRPGVIFGSDGIEGCEQAVFEILSNAIDEARGGFGDRVSMTLFKDGSIEVEDFGRGIPVDYNNKEERYNWELLFCEMYAGGKYDADGANYEYSLGLNGLGLCSTQYASRWMKADFRKKRSNPSEPARSSAGCPTGRFLPTSTFLPSIFWTCSNGRRWSTRGCCSSCMTSARRAGRRPSSGTKTASPTMSPNWRVKTR